MFLKTSQNSQENACAGVFTYQFNSQSMGQPDKHRKQPLEVFCKEKVFLKIEIPVLKSLFNKVAANQVCNFTKIRLQHSFFPVKFVKFLRTSILKNVSQQMLL